ncbi:hypothetical protein GJV26_12385 [Massilia dura]|uniref:Putative Flp pilus-assembly TadG-like N-terminal domain-containing protein n=1 Tax=Pseudoduganella dura TaxID=321982 RepID=A0A6I3XHY1_9BURK|nr:pilus assembly protein TadG-related protein [Pseudoduganella dura]MUI13251.1 hypothetical protein [Pseudoduganella dura]GGX90628.1 hypothetical protein GCM10007386_21840 [Pseudoduganella dura]
MSVRCGLRLPPGAARARQGGAILIMYAFMLMIILGFAGLVTDLGLVYYRKVQLQNAADAIALAAAQQLNGTSGGVDAAMASALAIAGTKRLGIEGRLPWNAGTQGSALRFSASPDAAPGAWMTAAEVRAAPAGITYARFDMSALDNAVHQLQPILMAMFGSGAGIGVGAVAVAGPTMLNATPLAICALSETPNGTRAFSAATSEVVTYGFRYGVTYNLLRLNPRATTHAYYLVNPVTPPSGAATAGDWNALGPFMCAGKLGYSGIGSGQLHLQKGGDAFALANQLNTRFSQFANLCSAEGAPNDRNVREFQSPGWQGTQLGASAQSSTADGRLATVADLPPGQPVAANAYGSLWAYGTAKWTSASQPGGAIGGSFTMTDWAKLYPGATAIPSKWATQTPYMSAASAHHISGADPWRRGRRLLLIPLLDCAAAAPAGAAPRARVLAYGRFFLTARASAGEVPGEFAGVVREEEVDSNVEVFR